MIPRHTFYVWTILNKCDLCSGAWTSERGSIYDSDDLSWWCGPLLAKRRKHWYYFQKKVTIQPEQQHCPCKYIQKSPLASLRIQMERVFKQHLEGKICNWCWCNIISWCPWWMLYVVDDTCQAHFFLFSHATQLLLPSYSVGIGFYFLYT